MKYFLYDPRTNVLTETSYDYLEKLTGKSRALLACLKSKGKKVNTIGCYFVDETITLKQRKEWYSKEKYPDEYWLNIEGSEGKYLVSNYGRFKAIYKKKTGLLMPFQRKSQGGHLEIKVQFLGKYGSHKVANIVAHHFIGPKKPGHSVMHKNLIVTDDFAGNLKYVTKQELGKITGYKSKSKAVVQLDRETLDVLGEFRSAREAGRQCYISYQAVMDNCNHKSKTSGGFVFMWEEEFEKLHAEGVKG